MQTHPEITHVSRDRSSEYASAVAAGAPQAIQVADRFHVAKSQVTKIKLIKRIMFGKAGFPLLRQRVLHAL